MEARVSSTTEVWRQNNLGEFFPKSQAHIKDEKHMNKEENKKNAANLRAPHIVRNGPCVSCPDHWKTIFVVFQSRADT
jgi:hypothetical protein